MVVWNPQIYWDFSEGSGTTTTDKTGRWVGTLTNGPTWNSTDKKLGNYSLEFDGTNDYVVTSTNAINYGTNAVSISCWCKPKNLGAYNTAVPVWLGNEDTALGAFGISHYVFWNIEDSTTQHTSTQPPSEENWDFIVITQSGGTVKIYVNGKLDAEAFDAKLEFSVKLIPPPKI